MIFFPNLKIKYKIIILVTTTITLSSIIFAFVLYFEIRNNALKEIDEKILIVENNRQNSNTVKYIYKVVDKGSIPPEIFKKIKHEHNKPIKKALSGFFFYNIIILIALLIIASTICLYLTRSITEPIYKLIAKTKEIALGNFNSEIKIVGNHELNILKEHYNLMLLVIKQKVDEVKKAEAKAKVTSSTLENFIDVIPHIFYSFKIDGRLIIWNKTLEKETGYNKAEIIQMKATDFFDKDEIPAIEESIKRVIKNGQDTVLSKILTKDKRIIPFSFSGNLLTLDDGTPYAIVGVATNISNQLKAEQQLKLQAEKLTEAAQNNTALQNEIPGEFIDSVNKILTYSEHIAKDTSGNSTLEDAKNINKYGLNLLKHINSLFKTSNNSSDTPNND